VDDVVLSVSTCDPCHSGVRKQAFVAVQKHYLTLLDGVTRKPRSRTDGAVPMQAVEVNPQSRRHVGILKGETVHE